MALVFDRVVSVEADGVHEYSAAEFLSLPIHARVAMVLARQVEFFLGVHAVDRRDALNSLRRDRVASAG